MHAEPSSLICLKFAFQERSIRDVKAQVLFHTILQEADFYNILFHIFCAQHFCIACLERILKHRHLLRVITIYIIRDEKQVAKNFINLRNNFPLGHIQLHIIIAQQKNVRVVAEGAPIELAAENGVVDGIFRCRILTMGQVAMQGGLPIKAHIRADAAKINLTIAGRERHAAAENELIAHTVTDEIHRFAHQLAAGFVILRKNARGIEEIELHHVVTPLVEDHIKAIANILRRLRMIEINGIEATPVEAR